MMRRRWLLLGRYNSPLTAAADHYVSKGRHYVPELERREFSRVESLNLLDLSMEG
jgi:hypothetical protein